MLLAICNRLLGQCRRGHVARQESRPGQMPDKLPGKLLEAILPSRDRDDVVAPGSKPPGHRVTDSGTRTGDQCNRLCEELPIGTRASVYCPDNATRMRWRRGEMPLRRARELQIQTFHCSCPDNRPRGNGRLQERIFSPDKPGPESRDLSDPCPSRKALAILLGCRAGPALECATEARLLGIAQLRRHVIQRQLLLVQVIPGKINTLPFKDVGKLQPGLRSGAPAACAPTCPACRRSARSSSCPTGRAPRM